MTAHDAVAGIDWEALAKAMHDAWPNHTTRWEESAESWRDKTQVFARAVIAALADQGLVVVSREDIDLVTHLIWFNGTREDVQKTIPPTPVDQWRAALRLRDAALTATAPPGRGGTGHL